MKARNKARCNLHIRLEDYLERHMSEMNEEDFDSKEAAEAYEDELCALQELLIASRLVSK